MSSKSKVMILCTIVTVIIYAITESSFVTINSPNCTGDLLFHNFYASLQKMLFNNTILLSILIYVNRCEFLNTLIAIRYNRSYYKIIILKTILSCSVLVCYLYFLYIISSLYFKIPIEVSAFSYVPSFFFYFLKLNSIYNLIYCINCSHVLSFFCIIIEGFLLLISYYGLGFVGLDVSYIIDIIINPLYCALLSVILNVFAIVLLKKRDIL